MVTDNRTLRRMKSKLLSTWISDNPTQIHKNGEETKSEKERSLLTTRGDETTFANKWNNVCSLVYDEGYE